VFLKGTSYIKVGGSGSKSFQKEHQSTMPAAERRRWYLRGFMGFARGTSGLSGRNRNYQYIQS